MCEVNWQHICQKEDMEDVLVGRSKVKGAQSIIWQGTCRECGASLVLDMITGRMWRIGGEEK